MGFPRQEYWNGLSFPSPRDLPDTGIEHISPVSPGLQADSLLLSHQGSPILYIAMCICQVQFLNLSLPHFPLW